MSLNDQLLRLAQAAPTSRRRAVADQDSRAASGRTKQLQKDQQSERRDVCPFPARVVDDLAGNEEDQLPISSRRSPSALTVDERRTNVLCTMVETTASRTSSRLDQTEPPSTIFRAVGGAVVSTQIVQQEEQRPTLDGGGAEEVQVLSIESARAGAEEYHRTDDCPCQLR